MRVEDRLKTKEAYVYLDQLIEKCPRFQYNKVENYQLGVLYLIDSSFKSKWGHV